MSTVLVGGRVLSHPVLEQLGISGVRLGLENVTAFLHFLGEPHREYPVVHVAGTNGKGSVCAYVASALAKAGYSVGTTLSPHLEAVNERIVFNGIPLDDAALTDAIEAHDRARWDWAASVNVEGVPLTYFEFVTTLAFHLFAQRRVDVAVVEVGMGGRLDATNVVKPLVAAVTHIGMDHMAELGTTIEAIATEKAGICKPGVPVVLGPMPVEARDTIERIAKLTRSPVWKPGRDLLREGRASGWNLSTPDGTLKDVKLRLRGDHQGANALVALAILHLMRRQGFLLTDDAIREGLETAYLGGRLETIRDGLLVDGAHNEDGTRVLAAWLKSQPRPRNRILLFGMGSERDPIRILAPLIPHVDEVVTTRCAHPKARPSYELAKILQEQDVVLSDGGVVEEALPEVYREADETVVAGSLYLVGAVKSLVKEGALDGIEPGQGASGEEEG